MAWLRRLVSRLKTAVRRWHLSPKSRPTPSKTRSPKPGQETSPGPSPSLSLPPSLLSPPPPPPSAALILPSPYIPPSATTPVPVPVPAPVPAPAPAAATAAPVSALSSFGDEPTDAEQVPGQWPSLQPTHRPPPFTRTSDSVFDAPIDEEQLLYTAQHNSQCQPRQRQLQQQSLSIKPPADEARKLGSHNIDRLSPGEWGWSTRTSRCSSVSSEASTSRASSQSRGSMDGGWLRTQLRQKRVVSHRNSRLYFIPICQQKSLLTIPNIENDIRESHTNHILEQADIALLAEKAYKCARKLYAILACLRKGLDIRSLLRMGITDKDLPFERLTASDGKAVLKRKSGETIEAFEEWDDGIIEEFDRIQWWMLAQVFEIKGHYDLEDGAILPFMRFKANVNVEQENEGGFSEVYPARIHPSHHRFWTLSDDQDNEQLVAIKRLHSGSEVEFDKERSMHLRLDSKGSHPHRITLLATFKHDRKYHLVFPYADANLKKYWEERPLPNFNRGTVYWSLKQVVGLADSLQSIHDLNVKYSPDQDCSELFGRHGDIKPENTLWYRESPGDSSSSSSPDDTSDNRGTLKLADFGLSRAHGRDSRSNVPWDDVFGSPTYEPPERSLHLPISRAYDIWSLGCLYLEFITWLLKGFEAVACFTRMRASAATGWSNDDKHFFSIVDGTPIIRKEVRDWVAMLHEHENCSALIHDLLEIIMYDLLCTDAGQRANAKRVVHLLESCLKMADEDDEYILKPVPSLRAVNGENPSTQRYSVTSEDEETALPAMDSRLKFSKNPLGRTPGQRFTRSTTSQF